MKSPGPPKEVPRKPGRPGKPDMLQAKQHDRKLELARCSLAALAELGFARMNLREVAVRSGTSLGILHYYFKDKNDLLIDGLRLYKEAFLGDLMTVIEDAADAEGLLRDAVQTLSRRVVEPGHPHRLWYDLRSQAMFDPAFRPIYAEIEGRMIGLCERFLKKLRALGKAKPPLDSLSLYLAIDGLVQYHLQRHIDGDEAAGERLSDCLFKLLKREIR